MNLWGRLTGRREQRSADLFSYASPGPWAGVNGSGSPGVSAAQAEQVAAVTSCINVIASSIGAQPPRLFQESAGVRAEVTGGPLVDLIRNPYASLDWSTWLEFSISQMMLHGNSVSEVVHDATGRVVALRPLPWERITPLRLLNQPQLGRVMFAVQMPNEPRRELLDSEVFWLKDRLDSLGILGQPRISRSSDVIRNAIELNRFSLASWQNGATPSGTVTLPAKLGVPGFTRLKAQFDSRHTGTANSRRIIYLDKDSEFKPISMTNESAEVNESKKFAVVEIARIWGVPVQLIMDMERSTFTNSETATKWLCSLTLNPIIRKIENEFNRSVIGNDSSLSLSIDVSDLVRADPGTRFQNYALARQNNFLTVDEIRESESYGPMPGQPVPAGETTEMAPPGPGDTES